MLDEPALAAFVSDLHAIRRLCGTWLTRCAEIASTVSDAPAADVIRSAGAVSRREASEYARRSEALADYDTLSDATRSGDLSSGAFDAITRAGGSLSDTDRTVFEEQLISAGAAERSGEMPPESFTRWVNGIADQVDTDRRARELADREAKSQAKTWTDQATGMTCLRAEFDEVRGTTIDKMLDDECRSILKRADKGTRQWSPNLRAEALYELIRRGATGETGPARYAGIILVDAHTAATGQLEAGGVCRLGPTDLPPSTAGRLLCDSTLRRVVLDTNGEVLDVGRKVRDATPAQRAALEALYGGCCWPGCDQPFRAIHIHHLHEWEHGGNTDLSNLRPLCVRHHHDVHEGGWTMQVLPGNRVAYHRPDGSLWQTTDPPAVTDQHQRQRRRTASPNHQSKPVETNRDQATPRGAPTDTNPPAQAPDPNGAAPTATTTTTTPNPTTNDSSPTTSSSNPTADDSTPITDDSRPSTGTTTPAAPRLRHRPRSRRRSTPATLPF